MKGNWTAKPQQITLTPVPSESIIAAQRDEIAALRAALKPAQRLVDVIFAEAQAEPFILPLRGMRAAGDLRAALAAAEILGRKP